MGAAAAHAACGKAPTVQAEGSARAERTENMYAMSVTLDVSRLSGWLNADAHCRVKKGSKGGLTCGLGGGTACGRRRRRMQRADRPRLRELRVGNARSAPKTWSP